MHKTKKSQPQPNHLIEMVALMGNRTCVCDEMEDARIHGSSHDGKGGRRNMYLGQVACAPVPCSSKLRRRETFLSGSDATH